MMTDPIADMLSRIRNAALARHDRVEMPHSHLKENLAHVLKGEGYVDDVRVSDAAPTASGGQRTPTVVLRRGRAPTSAMDGGGRGSTPGGRLYHPPDPLRPGCGGMGGSVPRTSRGVITDKES